MLVIEAGKKFRFFIQDSAGRRSSSWSISTSTQKNDVVVTHRDSGKWGHISLHDSGDSQYSATHAAKQKFNLSKRYSLITKMNVFASEGIRHCLRITFLHKFLTQELKEICSQNKLTIIQARKNFNSTNIDCLLVDPGKFIHESFDYEIVAVIALKSGYRLYIISSGKNYMGNPRLVFSDLWRDARETLFRSEKPYLNTRVVFSIQDPDKTHVKHELEVEIKAKIISRLKQALRTRLK